MKKIGINKMNKMLFWALVVVSFSYSALGQVSNVTDEINYLGFLPLAPPSSEWHLGEYWKSGKVGKRDFYIAEQGNYIRTSWKHKYEKSFRQLGVLDKVIPGHWNMKYFDTEVYKTLSPQYKELVDSWKENQWPLATIEYCIAKGHPAPSTSSVANAGELWLGDSMPEAPIYRLEPVFHYLKTGKLWRGSSMGYVDEESMITFFSEQLTPRLDKELPFYKDLTHKWTHLELRQLCDIYCGEFFKKVGKPIAWGMFLSPYFLAELPETTCVAVKGGDAFANSKLRGMNRQSGGGKFKYTWRGHEPTERFAYYNRGWYNAPGREDWGYPLPHIYYYMFRPYLMGANYSVVEGMPSSWVQDIEGDEQYKFSELGYIAKDLLDFIERHPRLGTPYAPVALLFPYSRDIPGLIGKTTFSGYNLPFDDADYMNFGVKNNILFPQHRHTLYTGGYSVTAPYGEVFDTLQPRLELEKIIDHKIFDGYKVLFGMGGIEFSKDNAEIIKEYVRTGGTLVLNIKDLGEYFTPEYFGVNMTEEKLTGKSVVSQLTGQAFQENSFALAKLELAGAEVIYSSDNIPVVTVNTVGKGRVILVAAEYMIQNEAEETISGHTQQKWQQKKLLKFIPDLFEHLISELTPFDICARPEDKQDISWMINKKGDGWTVAVFNYSLKREELNVRSGGTAKVIESYPYKQVPFEIACRAPMVDVMELYEDRNVNYANADGNIVVKETIQGGDIRVYEFQPHKIELSPRERNVNYALNKKVTASSVYPGLSPRSAVDGKLNNNDFWQSDLDEKRRYIFDLPQMLDIDLGEVEIIDHIFILFRTWEHRALEKRQFIYKYVIEASEDGEKWLSVIDERKNESPAHPKGLERWFEPVSARYVRLTVIRNSAKAGAQVVEIKVMGAEKETFQPQRKSIIPLWQIQWPAEIVNTPANKMKYLIGMKPKVVNPGWMPAGKEWHQLNGWVRLFTDNSKNGAAYSRSLYGESVSEFVYDIPAEADKFISAIGLGNKHFSASVVFKVFVDDDLKYESHLYRFGTPVLSVIVDVNGGKELKLVVTDGGDGIAKDYAWWGDPKFILK